MFRRHLILLEMLRTRYLIQETPTISKSDQNILNQK